MKKITTSALCLTLSTPAFAIIELSDNLSVSGFGSTSWATSDQKAPLVTNRGFNDDDCFDCDTTFGVQLDYYYDAFKASVQLVKRPQDNWSDPQFEWAYLGYEYEDFDVSIGRLRLPLFLASEYYYVGQAYMTARPPTEVYNAALGITAFNGVRAGWAYDLNDEASLHISPFFAVKDTNEVDLNTTTSIEFKTKSMYGANLQLNGDTYRWNFSYLKSNFDQETTIIGLPQPIADDDQDITLWSLGAEYELGNITLTSEGQINDYSSSLYASVGYHLDQLTPYFVYGAQFDSHEHLAGNSYLIGIDYDLLPNVSLNGEIQRFEARKTNGAFLEPPQGDSALLYTVMVSFVF